MLHDKLKKIREENGLTQVQMAELVGISPSSYNFYETGRQIPRVDVVQRICEHFNLSADALLDTGRSFKIETLKDTLQSVRALLEAGASVSSGLLTVDVDLSEIGKDELSQQVPVVLLVLEDHDLYGSVRILNIMEDAIDSSETSEERSLNEEAFARYLEGQLQHLADKKLSIPISPNLAEKILKQVKNIHFKD